MSNARVESRSFGGAVGPASMPRDLTAGGPSRQYQGSQYQGSQYQGSQYQGRWSGATEQTLVDGVMPAMSTNPKIPDDQTHPSNLAKDPDEWTTGGESMTGAQASYLKTLCEEAGEPFDPNLTKAEASKRIDALQAKTGRGRDH